MKRRLQSAVKNLPFSPNTSLQNHSRQWTQDGIPILLAEAALPFLTSSPHQKRINRFYRQYLRAFYRFCAKELLPRAKADFSDALAQSRPIPVTHAALRSTVTLDGNHILSLYTDLTASGSGRNFHTRSCDTWDLKTGYPLVLCDFFPTEGIPKKELIVFAREKATERINQGIAFHKDYRRALRRYFSSRRFYLTPQGLVFYYQPGCAAPISLGPLTFFMPYGKQGPRLPENTHNPPFAGID